jgi:hypothetical protein
MGWGNEGGVVTTRWHPRHGARRRGVVGKRWRRGRPEVRDGADSRGPLDREMWERRQAQKARTKRENVFLQRRDRHTGWMCWREGGGRPVGAARPVGWLGQRLSGPQGRPGQKQGKRISELKIGFLNLPRLWKFAQGDLGGILT